MSGPNPLSEPCEACGNPSVGQYPEGGHYLCEFHLKKAQFTDALEDELNQVVKDWAQQYKLTPAEVSQTLEQVSADIHKEKRLEVDIQPPKPERMDYFIECTVQHPALVLSYFHLLKNEAQLAGFPDAWTESIHLKFEVAGDKTRLEELRERVDALWLGAYVTESETLPKRI